MRTCTLCNETKAPSEFPVNKRGNGSSFLHSRCRACRRAQCRAWAKTEQGKAVKRRGILRREFRLTGEAYDSMLDAQAGVCAICRQPETKVHRDGGALRLCVDHDHATGAVRGLLCSGCNVGLGSFNDDIERLRAAAAYLASFLGA